MPVKAKAATPKAAPKAPPTMPPAVPKRTLVGNISHFYPKISVAVVDVVGELRQGDKLAIEGKNSFEQVAESMQIEHKSVSVAKPGQSIGLKVAQPVREGDKVYKLE